MGFFDSIPQDVSDSSLFKFDITLLNGTTVRVDLTVDFDIDYENLEHLLETVPAQYIYWAALYSELRHQTSFLEKRIAKRRALLVKRTVEKAHAERIKLTEKQVQAIVEVDEIDEEEITRMCIEHNNFSENPLNHEELQKLIETKIEKEKQNTLNYLEMQLLIAHRNAGKAYHVVQALQMKSENCRSLAGFKRQEKEQSSHLQ